MKKKKTWIAVVASVFVLITIAVPFWSFKNIEDKLNDQAVELDSYKTLESTEIEWNGRNCYLIVPGNIDEDIAQAAADEIEGIQGVRNVKIIYDDSKLLEDEVLEEPSETDAHAPEKSPGGFVLDWNQDVKNMSGTLDEDSTKSVEDIFGVSGLTIDDEYYISDDMLDKLGTLGAEVLADLNEGKLEVDGDKVKLSGTAADSVDYDELVENLSKYDWLEFDVKRPTSEEVDIDSEDDKVQEAIDKLHALDHIQFEFAEIRVKDSSVSTLNQIAEILLEYEEITLDIIGHADATGYIANNQVLSERRAEEVMNQLIKRGVDASRLFTYGMGETMPLDDSRTDEADQMNRRVEIIAGGND